MTRPNGIKQSRSLYSPSQAVSTRTVRRMPRLQLALSVSVWISAVCRTVPSVLFPSLYPLSSRESLAYLRASSTVCSCETAGVGRRWACRSSCTSIDNAEEKQRARNKTALGRRCKMGEEEPELWGRQWMPSVSSSPETAFELKG